MAVVFVSAVNAIYASDDDFSITEALINLTVNPNGLLHVSESYNYNIEGTVNGVYRDIPLKDGESIKNINVYVKGAYATYRFHVGVRRGQKGRNRLRYIRAENERGFRVFLSSVSVFAVCRYRDRTLRL